MHKENSICFYWKGMACCVTFWVMMNERIFGWREMKSFQKIWNGKDYYEGVEGETILRCCWKGSQANTLHQVITPGFSTINIHKVTFLTFSEFPIIHQFSELTSKFQRIHDRELRFWRDFLCCRLLEWLSEWLCFGLLEVSCLGCWNKGIRFSCIFIKKYL